MKNISSLLLKPILGSLLVMAVYAIVSGLGLFSLEYDPRAIVNSGIIVLVALFARELFCFFRDSKKPDQQPSNQQPSNQQ